MSADRIITWIRANWISLLLLLAAVLAFAVGPTWLGVSITLALAAVLVVRLQRRYYFLQYAFFLRYSILIAVAVFSFPIVALQVAPKLLGPLFQLGFFGVVGITVLSLIASWTVMFTSGLVYLGVAIRNQIPFARNAPRGQSNELPQWFQKYRFLWFGVLAAPNFVALFVNSQLGPWLTLLALAGGFALAYGVQKLTAPVAQFLADTFIVWTSSSFWQPFIDLLERVGQGTTSSAMRYLGSLTATRRLGQGIRHLADGFQSEPYKTQPASGPSRTLNFSPLRGLSFFFVLLIMYIIGYWLFQPPSRIMLSSEPPYAYILALFMLTCWLLNFLALFFDTYRVPVTVVVVATIFGLYQINNIDHYYAVQAAPADSAPPTLGPRESLAAWLDKHPADSHPTVVVVAAMGGGVRAGYWTNVVLDNLTQKLGPEFAESIVLMSTVSGGSVGAVYAIDAYPPANVGACQALKPELFADARDKSAQNSLHAIAWGFAYPDFLRKVLPFLPRNKLKDRGWALERKWTHTLGHAPTLTDWQVDTNKGCRPAIVFNATAVETGDRFLLGTIDIPKLPDEYMPTKNRKAVNFLDVFAGCDIGVFTAARLSATFPYITSQATDMQTPGCAPQGTPEPWGYHVADGGYYDNYGIVTTLDYLINVLAEDGEPALDLSDRNVLILQIRASDVDKPGEKGAGKGFTYSIAGPVIALMNVRATTQIARNDVDIELVKGVFGKRAKTIEAVAFDLGDTGPLSWDLTVDQKDEISAQWEVRNNPCAVQKIRRLFPGDAASESDGDCDD